MKITIGSSSDFIKESVGTPVLHHPNQVSLKDIQSHGKPVVLLVDADIVAYRCSATADGRKYTVDGKVFQYKKEATKHANLKGLDPKKDIKLTFVPEPETKALLNVSGIMKALKKETEAHKVECYLTPDILFRSEYASDYKKNREGLRKPHHLKACKKYLEDRHHAEQLDGYEADDLLAIRARQLIEEGKYTPIIASLDKDLDMVSCYHYQWTKKCFYFVTPEEGTLNFYRQVLTGDKTDNIPGLWKVGPVTADKILEGLDGSSSYDCYLKVLEAYIERTPKEEGESDEDFYKKVIRDVTKNARLLYILHKLGEVWYPPVATEEEEQQEESKGE